MKTKAEVSAEYDLNVSGMIVSPGKFEAEPWWLVALYDLSLDSGADETVYDNDTAMDVFLVDADLRLRFDLAEEDHAIVIWTTEQGFCEQQVLAEPAYTAWLAEVNAANESEEGE